MIQNVLTLDLFYVPPYLHSSKHASQKHLFSSFLEANTE